MRQRVLIILCAVVVAVVNSGVVAAVPDWDWFSDNNILFYIPEGEMGRFAGACDVSDGRGLRITVSGATAAEKIWSGLIRGGLNAAQAAGVMGNLWEESNFSPTIQEIQFRGQSIWNPSTSHGIGLAQWSFGRRIALLHVLEERGLVHYIENWQTYSVGGDELIERGLIPADDLNLLFAIQIQFIFDEMAVRTLRNGGPITEIEGLRATTTPEEAAEFFNWNFERPANPDPRARQAKAREIYEEFRGTEANIMPECDYGGLIETVLAYAWPTYHAPPFLEMMPAYRAAVDRARSEGRYVGGGIHPGIDCGGFTTTLIYDSGWDRGFNHNARGGPTGTQEAWVMNPANGWDRVNPHGVVNTADLIPGDVAFTTGHTFIWVGEIPGFGEMGNMRLMIASASFSTTGRSWRTPMAGMESPFTAGNEIVRWYRRIGQ
ncbi:phage tail tip lysozyme [Candidatus Saccharibacteria bacterium]|nr:phage tail tip lysozyme [Candidatus Saccharibacteria bacterium]